MCAEIPDAESQPRPFETVRSMMVHGPSGVLNPRSVCMESGAYVKNCPKSFARETVENVNGYPVYRRRDDGTSFLVRKNNVDNRWIVPYNPWLSTKFNAYINVEVRSTVRSVKYLSWYVCKGYDSANVQIRQLFQRTEQGVLIWDEVTSFMDARYVSAPESMWRLNENEMHKQSHTIPRLAVHLPLQQNLIFREENEVEAFQRAETSDTTLTAFFKLNAEDPNAREFHYHQIPEHYVWDVARKKWKNRLRGGHLVIGRFCEPHRSGTFLLAAAASACERPIILHKYDDDLWTRMRQLS